MSVSSTSRVTDSTSFLSASAVASGNVGSIDSSQSSTTSISTTSAVFSDISTSETTSTILVSTTTALSTLTSSSVTSDSSPATASSSTVLISSTISISSTSSTIQSPPSGSVSPVTINEQSSISPSSSFSGDTRASVVTSSIVTTLNGIPTTMVTVYPTSLNSAPKLSSSQRMGVVIGSAVGGVVLIFSLLSCAILYQRHRRRKSNLAHQRLPMARRTRLEDEDDFVLTANVNYLDDSPRLMRPRALGSGSIFHEGVWPPPGHSLEDPIRAAGSEVDLSSIVDDVMGGGNDALHPTEELGRVERLRGGFEGSQLERRSIGSGYSYQPVHSRDHSLTSIGSQVALAPHAAGEGSPMSSRRSVTFTEPPETALRSRMREAANSSRLSVSTTAKEAEVIRATDAHSLHGPGHVILNEADRSIAGNVRSTPIPPHIHEPAPARAAASPQLSRVSRGREEVLVDVSAPHNTEDDLREIPPLYHTIRTDTAPGGDSRIGGGMDSEDIERAI